MIIAPEESKAALALPGMTEGSDEYAATAYLAAQPTAYWLTPEIDPVDEVGARMENLLSEARSQNKPLAIVVYGLPERDCSAGHSAGGLDNEGYDLPGRRPASGERDRDRERERASCGASSERDSATNGLHVPPRSGPGTMPLTGWHQSPHPCLTGRRAR